MSQPRRAWFLALAAALLACGESFAPPSQVDGLRILAVQAEPPEIGHREDLPDHAVFTSLVADPAQLADPERAVLVAYLACTPDPFSAAPSPCTAVATLRDPTEWEIPAGACPAGDSTGGSGDGFAEGPAVLGPGGDSPLEFIGVERCDQEVGCRPARIDVGGFPLELPPPTYRLPEAIDLGALPTNDPKRMRGMQVMIYALATVGTEDEVLDGLDPTDPCFGVEAARRFLGLVRAREHRMALKRLQVRGPDLDDEPNVNPRVEGMLARGVPIPVASDDPWPAAATFPLGGTAHLHPRPPAPPVDDEGVQLPLETLMQPYTRLRVDGSAAGQEREEWLVSWFTTAGALASDRTRGLDESVAWELPRAGDAPGHRRAFVYLVLRDGRGGISWVAREVRLASP